jgi:ABC transporter substrate binding protein
MHNVPRIALSFQYRESEYAAEFAASKPDVIVASGTNAVAPLLQATRTEPIVFMNVADPVGAGFVKSLARPGGNSTGFILFEFGLSGKWLELLKQVAPALLRVVALRDRATSGIGQFAAIQAVRHLLESSYIRSTFTTPVTSSARLRRSRAPPTATAD